MFLFNVYIIGGVFLCFVLNVNEGAEGYGVLLVCVIAVRLRSPNAGLTPFFVFKRGVFCVLRNVEAGEVHHRRVFPIAVEAHKGKI